MKIFSSRVTWGLLLIGAGAVLLLQNLNLLPQNPIIWIVVFGVGALYFLLGYFSSREYWWAAIPAFSLMGLSLMAGWELIFRNRLSQDLSTTHFLGIIGLGFIAVYLRSPKQWWAIIPAGALISIAGVGALETLIKEPGPVEIGGVLFLGMGVTFFLVFLLPSADGRRRWAIWPAIGLLFVGGMITAAATDLLGILWPVALILAGLLVIMRGFKR
ncbi:MAG: hypothetical protein HC806_06195 [Anaerolineae bacterium]|nr:hypothetical protein [Anaerolineae bacterium]